MTNFEYLKIKISRMNEKELADFIHNQNCPPDEGYHEGDGCQRGNCSRCWKEWLRMEADVRI